MNRPETLWLRKLGRQNYEPVWRAMQHYTDIRDANSPDELWFLEHDAVFTQGQAGKAEHILMPGEIAQLGLRVRRGSTFHGLSLNIDMDLSVFQRINPCGHQGMEVTDIRRQSAAEPLSQNELTGMLSTELAGLLGYLHCREVSEHSLPDASGVL